MIDKLHTVKYTASDCSVSLIPSILIHRDEIGLIVDLHAPQIPTLEVHSHRSWHWRLQVLGGSPSPPAPRHVDGLNLSFSNSQTNHLETATRIASHSNDRAARLCEYGIATIPLEHNVGGTLSTMV